MEQIRRKSKKLDKTCIYTYIQIWESDCVLETAGDPVFNSVWVCPRVYLFSRHSKQFPILDLLAATGIGHCGSRPFIGAKNFLIYITALFTDLLINILATEIPVNIMQLTRKQQQGLL